MCSLYIESFQVVVLSLPVGWGDKRPLDPGAPLTYFNNRGVRRIFLGLTFWPKGIFLGRENNTGIFLGYCIFHQLKSKIT